MELKLLWILHLALLYQGFDTSGDRQKLDGAKLQQNDQLIISNPPRRATARHLVFAENATSTDAETVDTRGLDPNDPDGKDLRNTSRPDDCNDASKVSRFAQDRCHGSVSRDGSDACSDDDTNRGKKGLSSYVQIEMKKAIMSRFLGLSSTWWVITILLILGLLGVNVYAKTRMGISSQIVIGIISLGILGGYFYLLFYSSIPIIR